MFQKKCMVVGSLLVMAAQTVTANALCSTADAGVICAGALYTGALIGAANSTNCADAACSVDDKATCCEVLRVNCDTITLGTSPSLTEVCGGDDAFTGALIGSASSTKCAGAACGLVDKSTCCAQKAACDTITTDSSPNLATVCGNDPGYTGALGSSSAKCAGATCGTSDKGTCCAEKSSAGDDGDGDDDDDDDDNKFSNTCTAPKDKCDSAQNYLSGFKGGCHSCDDGPESCADLVSMIKKGGCYAECAVGWSESTINRYSTEHKCEANEIEKALGRKTPAELKKEMDAVGCGEKEMYCGPAQEGGMTKDYIPEFKGGCHSCDKSPADCKEAIDLVTTGCYASCSVGMTPEAVAELMKRFSCTKAETKTAQDAVALEQKAMLSAGESLLVNGLSLAALAAAAVFSAVC